jgi:metal-sulfur cluster biosynthetic enzyme
MSYSRPQSTRCTVTVDQVHDALAAVLDPCATAAGVRGSIVEMGIVREVRVQHGVDGAHVHLSIGVTEPTCIMFHAFARDAHREVAAMSGVREVTVELAEYQIWTEDDMAPRLRNELAAVRQRRGLSPTVIPIRDAARDSSPVVKA